MRIIFSEDSANQYGPAAVVLPSLLIVAHICLAALTLFLIFRSKRTTVHLLVANAVGGGLFFTVFVRPGSIRLMFQFLPVTMAYCWIHIFLHQVEAFFIPWAMFMFTVDRLNYIRNPTAYAQKDSKKSLIAMLVIPWVLPLCVATAQAVVARNAFMTTGEASDNATWYGCMLEPVSAEHHIITGTYMVAICEMIPTLIGLVAAIVCLSMWCCFKRRQSVNSVYSMLDSHVVQTVRNSVIAVSFLNLLLFAYSFFSAGMYMVSARLLVRDLVYIVLPMIACVVWLTTLPGLRQDLKWLCCRRKHIPVSEVHYNNDCHNAVDVEAAPQGQITP